MFKRALFLGITAGIFSTIACVIYAKAFYWVNANMFDFSSVVGINQMIGACMFTCVLASIGFWFADYVLKLTGQIIFNFIFTLISFASIVLPFAYTLPLTLEFPEMFPGMVIPMHFFPVLIWFTLKPIFIKS